MMRNHSDGDGNGNVGGVGFAVGLGFCAGVGVGDVLACWSNGVNSFWGFGEYNMP